MKVTSRPIRTADLGGLLPAAAVPDFGCLFVAVGGASAAGAGVELRLLGSARALPLAGLLAASTFLLFAG